MTRSRVLRRGAAGWEGVEARRYKDEADHHAGVARHTLLAASEPEGPGFETRYFEVAPGGYTSFERHAHPHVVLVLRGRGSVRLGERIEPLAELDVVYVAPWEPHRFLADGGEPLGFLCVVDGDRDTPQVMREDGDPR